MPVIPRPSALLAAVVAAPLAAACLVVPAQAGAPVRATAFAAGDISPRITPDDPRTSPSVGALVSVDVGGAGNLDADGVGYTGDNGFTGGLANVMWDGANVAGEAPAAVNATNRFGGSTYDVRNLTPGQTYTLRLHLVEDYFDAPGKRVFDVTANGAKAFSRLDIFAEAGGTYRPVHRDATVTADARGRLHIEFQGDASIAAFQILGRMPYTRLGSYLPLKNLRVVPTGPTTTHVSWTPVAGIARYAVLRDGVIIGRTTEPAYVDATAVAGRTYSYSAAAIDPDGSLGLLVHATRITMPSATPKATGRYHVEGTRIIDPDGKVFVPVGINIGTQGILDAGGSARGHSVEAKQWGWNTVRLVVRPDQWNDEDLRATIDEYRAAGMVVIIDAHHMWNPWDPMDATYTEQVRTLWQVLAPRYKNDSGVWFNVVNEPGDMNDEWVDDNELYVKTIRDLAVTNIVLVDAPTWGQDLGHHLPYHAGARFAYTPTMAPLLAARYGNVVLDQHNYGGYYLYTTPATYSAYIDAVHAGGLPLLSGEFGYTYDNDTSGGSYGNKLGADAVFATALAKGVGVLAWNGNGNDRYSMKSDGSAFWSGGAGAKLSPLGQQLWNLTH